VIRNTIRWCLVILVNVLIIEIICYVFLIWAQGYRPQYFKVYWETHIAAVDDNHVNEFKSKGYDAHLGWDNKLNHRRVMKNSAGVVVVETYDSLGARTNPLFRDNISISSYGDSHTQCAEVNDDETWQYYLSERLRSNVQNFGVAGYGTDQALIKLERNLEKGILTPSVILAIHEENINRIVNTFRPFYSPATGWKLGFKPRFIVEDGQLKIIPNPLAHFNSRVDVLRALASAKKNDYWFQQPEWRVEMTFPFSLTALDLGFAILDRKGFLKHPYKEIPSRRLLWDDPEVTEIVSAIVNRFVEVSQEFHFRAILLLLPHIEKASDGSLAEPNYHAFVIGLRERYDGQDLTIIDMSKAEFDLDRFRVLPEEGHTSAYGNKIIAEFIHRRL